MAIILLDIISIIINSIQLVVDVIKLIFDLKIIEPLNLRSIFHKNKSKNPQNIKELVNTTQITYSTLSSNLHKLQQEKYIQKIKNKYYLTQTTKMYLNIILEFKNAIKLINQFDEFWDKHDVKQINLDSLKNITSLHDSQLIKTTPIDIYKTHNTIKGQLLMSYNIKAIFPYYPLNFQKFHHLLLIQRYLLFVVPVQ